jgi:TetR/AcrR family transcriptional regulator
MTKDSTTEEKILEASKNVFLLKGFEGARMQEIADEAGINKSLLHYYFRTKEKLFEMVFENAVSKMIPNLFGILNSDISLFEKIEKFFEVHIGFLQSNQFLPTFIMHEINQNPKKVIRIFAEQTKDLPMKFGFQIMEEIEKGNIVKLDPFQLIINMVSLSVFPFAAKPLVEHILTTSSGSDYDEFLEARKKTLPEFVINSIRKK